MPFGTRGLSPQQKISTNVIIDSNTECWVWQPALQPSGYGVIRYKGKRYYAHRLSYIVFVGPIANSLVIDHKCRNKFCVNPKHLEAVTQKVNLNRGLTRIGKFYEDPICKNEHDMTIVGRTKRNQCRQCDIEYQRNWRAKNKLKGV